MKMKYYLCCLYLVILFLTGCNKESHSSLLDGEHKLKVLYPDEIAFTQRYGNFINAKYPNIEFDVVSPNSIRVESGENAFDKISELVTTEKPDIIISTLDNFAEWVNSNKLLSLNALIKQKNFPIDKISGNVIEALKTKGGEDIFGIPPTFNTQALFYNKELFDKKGVKYPDGQMDWSQVLQLANQFSDTNSNEKTYGLFGFYRTPYDLLMSIGTTEDLRFVDNKQLKMTIETKAWERITEQVINSYKAGVVFQPNENKDIKDLDQFVRGKAAMTVEPFSYTLNLKQSAPKLHWGIVVQPISLNNPTETPFFSTNQIFSINAQSEKSEIAWEVIQYINGPEFAKIHMKTDPTELSSRIDVIKQLKDHELEPFYQLKPNKEDVAEYYSGLPDSFMNELEKVITDQLHLVLQGKETVQQSLHVIQEDGNKLLFEQSSGSALDK